MDADAKGATQGGARVQLGDFELIAGKGEEDITGHVKITIRPERVVLSAAGQTAENTVPGMVERTVYVGSIMQILVNLASGARIQAWVPNDGKVDLFPSGTARRRADAARRAAGAARHRHADPRELRARRAVARSRYLCSAAVLPRVPRAGRRPSRRRPPGRA